MCTPKDRVDREVQKAKADQWVPVARTFAPRTEDVRNVLLWLDTVTRLGPQASQVLNMGEAARWLAMMLGVPDELVREEDPLTALAGALAQQGTGNGRP